jgi:hypothetical protein
MGLKAVAKDSVNPHFKNKYASLDAMIDAVRPVLAKHGLAIIQGALDSDPVQLSCETMLIHESGEWLAGGVTLPLGKSDPQGAGAAMTYARRYGLAALLSLATEEDDDGHAATPPRAQPEAKAATPGKSAGFVKVMPFGKFKGTNMGELPSAELERTKKWCVETDAAKFKDLIATCNSILTDRSLDIPVTDEERDAVATARLAKDELDLLPF